MLNDLKGVNIHVLSDDDPKHHRCPRAAAADDLFIVSHFDLLERLVERGVPSHRIAIAPPGLSREWIDGLKVTNPHTEIIPPAPYESQFRTLVVLPTYNERANLSAMVAAIHAHLVCDVLIADDNSPDGTGAIADTLSAADSRVRVLHRPTKEGLGRAYIAGFRWAMERDYQRVIQMDCDFSHSPCDLPRLVHASASADLVIGSRYVRGGRTDGWSWMRRQVSRGNTYTRLLLGFSVRDWTAGFRCLTVDLLRRLHLDDIAANGFGFQVEIVWKAKNLGAAICEIPINFRQRRAGASKMSRSIIFEALRLVPAMRFSAPSRALEAAS